MFPSVAKRALRDAQLLCKKRGAPILLRWTEWPGGRPTPDPTTGALLVSEDASSGSAEAGPLFQSCKTRAFTHFISPAMSTARLFAEIQTGDCIMDFVLKLVRIGDAGDTSFTINQVVDLFTFNAANRALTPDQFPAVPSTTDVRLETLENASVVIFRSVADQEANVNGDLWVQQKIGENLARSWGVIYSDMCLGQAILLRKAT